MIVVLLDAGASIIATDARGYTPLILARYNGQVETAQLLIAPGAAIDQPDGDRGNTALMGLRSRVTCPSQRCCWCWVPTPIPSIGRVGPR